MIHLRCEEARTIGGHRVAGALDCCAGAAIKSQFEAYPPAYSCMFKTRHMSRKSWHSAGSRKHNSGGFVDACANKGRECETNSKARKSSRREA